MTQPAAAFRLGWRMWIPSAAMMLCTLLAYIDRLTLAALSPTILADTGLNQEQYGWAVFAFSIAYVAARSQGMQPVAATRRATAVVADVLSDDSSLSHS